MARQRLSEDELRWILSIDASDAEQEIHKYNTENKKLIAHNKELRKAMLDLEKAGKINSQEYRNLTNLVNQNNNAIAINRQRVSALEGTLGLTSLTMAQLRKKAKDLQRQLDTTSQALHPEEYDRLQRELNQTRNRMEELRASGRQTGSVLGESSGMISKLSMAVKAFMALKIVGYLKDLVLSAFNVRKEFAKYEAVLRNTFQSQEKATEAMKMLKKLTMDTPYQLQELTEAYIKMVNRGMIPTEQEIIKLGDLASSQGKSLDQLVEALLDAQTGEFERLKEFGIKSNKEGDKVKFTFKGISTEVKFTEKAISDYILGLGELKGVQGGMLTQMNELEGMTSNFGDAVDGLLNRIGTKLEPFFKAVISTGRDIVQSISDTLKPIGESFDDQMNKVISLEETLPPLVERYNQLKSKAQLSKEEHIELNRTLSNLANIVPGAITEWDKYGNAIDINTQKVYQFLEAEQNRLKYIHADAIKQAQDDLEKYTILKEKEENNLKLGGHYEYNKSTIFPDFVSWTPKETAKIAASIKEYGEKIQGAEETIKKLTGESLRQQVETQKETIKKRAEFNAMTKEQLSEYIQVNQDAADKYVDIAQEIYANKFTEPKKEPGKEDKELKKSLELQLREQETAHAQELSVLKKKKLETYQTEQFYNLEVLHADAVYYQKRIQLLQQFHAQANDKKLKADLNRQIADSQGKLLEIQLKRDQEVINALKDNRNKQLKIEEASYKAQKTVYEKSLADKKITQEQYAALLLMLDASSTEQRLKILQDYQSNVAGLELQSGNTKAQAVTEANQAVLNADLQAAQARANQQKMLQNLVKDFKGEFKLTTVGEETDLQLKTLEAAYQARKEMAEKANMDTTELTAAYEKAKTNILQQEEDKRNQVRSQYGLLSLQEQYELEQEELKRQYDQGLIDEEEYQKAKNQIKVNYLKKGFDYYSGLFSGAISALQQAELSNIDAKYDAEIERAQGNSEEVERLENEKEQKKLDVQKKYADVQFAVKVSEIIANTAVAIMQAFAQLGPIGGAITAALMGVTGAAQVAVANAERKKIKNMTVNGTSSGSGTGSRVVTGRESGGKIDVIRQQDRKRFEAAYDPDKRGYVDKPTVIVGEGPAGQSREWIASNAALENPTVAPIISLLNQEQEKGTIRTVDMNQLMRQNLAGFNTGGFISSVSSQPAPAAPSTQSMPSTGDNNPELKSIMSQLITLLTLIRKEGIHAWILYNEFQKTKDLIDKSQNIGKK